MKTLIHLVCALALLTMGCHLSMKGLDQAQLPGAESHPAWDASGQLYILEPHTVPVPQSGGSSR